MTTTLRATLREQRDARALAVLPGGTTRGLTTMTPLAPRAVRGEGYRVFGENGETWTDLNNNFTALIHGHAHPELVEASVQAIRDGASFGMSTMAEIELAELLVERIPWARQVRFSNSGTEAVMTSVRVARVATGRTKVVFLSPSYHGSSDPALVALGGTSTHGVPESVFGDIIRVAPGDEDQLDRVFADEGSTIAGFVLDLVPARAGARPLAATYVERARALTRQHGALLIADEVVTLRHGYAGMAHSHYRIEPDLAAIGKIMGGGLPVGATLGTADVMRFLDPRGATPAFHGGTFSGNPVSMYAGLAAMRLFDEVEVARLSGLGDRLRSRLVDAAPSCGVTINGFGSSVKFVYTDSAAEPISWRDNFWRAAERRGVLISPVQLTACLSTPMDEAVVDDVAERLIATMQEVADRGEGDSSE